MLPEGFEAFGPDDGQVSPGRQDEAESEDAEGDLVRQHSRLEVGRRQDDGRRRQQRPGERHRPEAVEEGGREEDGPDERFDERVPGRDRRPAGAAAAPQEEPREDGDVVAGGDRRQAGRAAGARGDDGRALREPVNADVREGAEDGPEREDERKDEDVFRLHRPRPPGGPASESARTPRRPATESQTPMRKEAGL